VSDLDELAITGLRARAAHGVFAHERETPQPFVVDVVLFLRLADAAAGDDLASTVHYGELSEAIVAAIERDPVDLIETLAERVASLCLEHERVVRVRATVHKPEAPIAVPFDDVSVTVVRSRA
jgi:7,8-dihydroneopterin aldolase/epimerase/oxygenase